MKIRFTPLIICFLVTQQLVAEPPPFTVTNNLPATSPMGICNPGQEVTFTIQRNDTTFTNTITVKILRENTEILVTEEMPPTEQTHTIHFTPQTSNWFLCKASSPSLTTNGKTLSSAVGIIIEPDKITPAVPEPADFDSFWNEKRALLTSHPATPKITSISEAQVKQEEIGNHPGIGEWIDSMEKGGYQAVNVEIDCPGVKPVEGVYAHPKESSPKSRPAIIRFHPAGVSWSRAETTLKLSKQYQAIVLDINAHGMLNGQPQDYYTALAEGELSGYPQQGKEDREKYYFLGMYLRLMRAIDFICSQPEWDGKHLICVGSSQGGGQALIAAGLDKRVSAVTATVPALCDLTGPIAGRCGGWPNPISGGEQGEKIISAISYFDTANHVVRSQAVFWIVAGLADDTCCASSIYTTYNRIPGKKEIILYPDKGHQDCGSGDVERLREEFIYNHIKETPRNLK